MVKRKYFVRGTQDNIEDVLSTIMDFFQFNLSQVDFKMADPSTYSLILLYISEFVEYIYGTQFKSLSN